MEENPIYKIECDEPKFKKHRLSNYGKKAKEDFIKFALDNEDFFDSAVNGVKKGEPIMFSVEQIDMIADVIGYLVDEKKICVDFSRKDKEFSLSQLRYEIKKKER